MDRRSLLASLLSLPAWLIGMVSPSTAAADRWKRLWSRERAISQGALDGQLVIHELAMKNKTLADDATRLVHAAAGWMHFEASKFGFTNVPFVGLLTAMHEWLATHDITDERRSHQKYLAGVARRLLHRNKEERERINTAFRDMLLASDAYQKLAPQPVGSVSPAVCHDVVDAIAIISMELGIARCEGTTIAMFVCNIHPDVIGVGLPLAYEYNRRQLASCKHLPANSVGERFRVALRMTTAHHQYTQRRPTRGHGSVEYWSGVCRQFVEVIDKMGAAFALPRDEARHLALSDMDYEDMKLACGSGPPQR